MQVKDELDNNLQHVNDVQYSGQAVVGDGSTKLVVCDRGLWPGPAAATPAMARLKYGLRATLKGMPLL